MLTPRFRLIVIAFVALFASTTFSQERCIELKHIEFFVPSGEKLPNWSEKQLNELLGQPATGEEGFFIPFIVKQLSDYEPGCGMMLLDKRFDLLIKLYSAIRKDNRLSAAPSGRGKLELIRRDFYKQINDDRLFGGLIYTMDDGPLMGRLVSVSSIRPIASREFQVPFGKIRFANFGGGVAVNAIDKRGRSLWSRVLGGVVPKRELREADLKSLTVEETDFVIVARLFVDGERLTLYVRPNGRFMYYTHSW